MTVASLPLSVRDNPYPRLLQAALRARGVETVPAAARLRWALKARTTVDVLHMHWLELYVNAWGPVAARWRPLAPVVYLLRALRILAILGLLRSGGVRVV